MTGFHKRRKSTESAESGWQFISNDVNCAWCWCRLFWCLNLGGEDFINVHALICTPTSTLITSKPLHCPWIYSIYIHPSALGEAIKVILTSGQYVYLVFMDFASLYCPCDIFIWHLLFYMKLGDKLRLKNNWLCCTVWDILLECQMKHIWEILRQHSSQPATKQPTTFQPSSKTVEGIAFKGPLCRIHCIAAI